MFARHLDVSTIHVELGLPFGSVFQRRQKQPKTRTRPSALGMSDPLLESQEILETLEFPNILKMLKEAKKTKGAKGAMGTMRNSQKP